MRVVRLFSPQSLTVGTELQLDEATRHYAINVLRLNKTSSLTLFNGDGFDYCCEILTCSKKNLLVKITNRDSKQTESPLNIHLYLGISKSSHMDYAIQKTVEVGVDSIQPVLMERTVSKASNKSLANKHLHWQRIIQSACEQSGRAKIPALLNTCALEEIEALKTHECGILFDTNANQSMDNLQNTNLEEIKLIVGPEGGITENEIMGLTSKGFQTAHCGPRILRTETAALTAVLLAQWLYGDLKT